MPIISFSEPAHIPLILQGLKTQTTRRPRKIPLKQGDKLYMYYQNRLKKSCTNCIVETCQNSAIHSGSTSKKCCERHSNFFGVATVLKIEDFDPYLLSREALEKWAQADGFKNYKEAYRWFTTVYGRDWENELFEIIYFKGDWNSPST